MYLKNFTYWLTLKQNFKETLLDEYRFALCQNSSKKRSRSTQQRDSLPGQELNSTDISNPRSSSFIEKQIFHVDPLVASLNGMINNQNDSIYVNSLPNKQKKQKMLMEHKSHSLELVEQDNGYCSLVTSEDRGNFNSNVSTKRPKKRYYYHI